MLSIAYAFAPVAMVSLFAAAVPVMTGLRHRHARVGATEDASGTALEITGGPSGLDDSLAIGLRNRTAEVRTLGLSVSIYDERGAECARFDLPSRRLLPGRSVHEHLDLHALPEGSYRAVVVAELSGEWFGAQYRWTRSERPIELAPAA
jgi:hypothetical protein